jgi:hypothetical protein
MAGPSDPGDPVPNDARDARVPGHFVSPEHETDTARFLDEVRARIRNRRRARRELQLDDPDARAD